MVFNRRNLDWWCERGILILVLAALVFSPLAFGAVFTWTFLVVQALVLGVVLLWLVRIWGGHKPKLLWPPLAWVVLAFVLYAIGRYLTADIEYLARLEMIRVLMYAILLFAVINNLYDQDSAEIITYTLTVVAVLASSYAVMQFFHHSNHVWNRTTPYPGRASGTYVNPDHFAAFLEMVLPLAMSLLLAGRIGVITRVLLTYATLTIMAGIVVTFSRGGWVGAAMGVLMLLGFLLGHRNHRLRAALVLVVLLAGGYIASHVMAGNPTYMRRVAKVDNTGPAVVDFSSRIETWKAAAHMCQDHPLWGVGPGHFDARFMKYRSEAFQMRPDHAHCDYLELLADWGLVGGVIVFAGVGAFIFGLVKSWPHVRREENDFGSAMSTRYAFFLGGVSGLFALAVHSLVDFNLHITADALTGVVILGLVTANIRFATKRYWVRARMPLQAALTVAIVGLTVYFGLQMQRRGGEMVWLARAEQQNTFSTEQIDDLKKALAYEPKDDDLAYNIGDSYWALSLNGGDNYDQQAKQALTYYEMSMKLNPYNPDAHVRAGMCLDWLGQFSESGKYYEEAEALDPNGDFVAGNIGWHYMQTGDYSAARQWFIRANKLANWKNDTAKSYLFDICEPRLMERASGKIPISLFGGKGN